MTDADIGLDSIISEAKRLGEEREKLERKNKIRISRGLNPLPNDVEIEEKNVRNIRRTPNRRLTVNSSQAQRLYEKRRAAMLGAIDDDDEDIDSDIQENNAKVNKKPSETKSDPDTDRAQKEAAAARRVADMKNGRINHESVWNDNEQKLEGGDNTSLPQLSESKHKSEKEEETRPSESVPPPSDKVQKGSRKPIGHCLRVDEFFEFKQDLYYRLKESFAGIEQTLSDLQGRVAELSAFSSPKSNEDVKDDDDVLGNAFSALLDRKVPIVFDANGLKMSFDAVTVFHASPCITIVTKIGSASIKPKPGARLNISYEMNGTKYTDDPVTFLGTRFELPEFGIAFIGFIRDIESGSLDVE